MIKSSGMTVTPLRTAMTSPTVPPQHKTTTSRISNFSVASLLADTRPKSPAESIILPANLSQSPNSPSPLSHPDSNSTKNERLTHSPQSSGAESDVDYDSNQEDSIVDIEDMNQDTRSPVPHDLNKAALLQQAAGLPGHVPIRPTPFSALAAAAAAWGGMNGGMGWPGARQLNPFGPPGLFPGQSFGPGHHGGGKFNYF